jgi:hypothetical protein
MSLTPLYTSAAAKMSPDQAKAPEKVALISLFFLETSVTLRIPKANDSLLLDAV